MYQTFFIFCKKIIVNLKENVKNTRILYIEAYVMYSVYEIKLII